MYYEDLTPYNYSFRQSSGADSDFLKACLDQELIKTFSTEPSELILLNVGWLAKGFPFPISEINLVEVEKIASLCLSGKNEMRGFDLCPFCEFQKTECTYASGKKGYHVSVFEQKYKSQVIPLGYAEIWIKGKSNKVYFAPTLILHYIMEHGYAMPAEVKNALNEMM